MLLAKCRHYQVAHDHVAARRAAAVLEYALLEAADGAKLFPTPPTITALGVQLQLTPQFALPMDGLFRVCPAPA